MRHFNRVRKGRIRAYDYKGFAVWAPLVIDGKHTANVRCPQCHLVASLDDHEIAADGTVTPSAECTCGFHEHIVLDNWGVAEIENSAAPA